MEAIIDGVLFKLNNFNKEGEQTVRFVSKQDEHYIPGTTNEEVVNMLIDRFYFLQKKSFSVENQVIIENLKTVRRMLAKRLANKINKVNMAKEDGEKD